MKSIQAIKSDLSALVLELDKHTKFKTNVNQAHADFLERENKELKAKLKKAFKSQSAFKGLYESKRKYARRLESENRELIRKNKALAQIAETQLTISGRNHFENIQIPENVILKDK